MAEVEAECEERIKLFKTQIGHLTDNSTQLSHELKLLQDAHREILIKHDTLVQENIYRELRKRDFEAKERHLSDLAQTDAMRK